MALVRIIMEIIQLILKFPRYLSDEINWIEMMLYISSIIFVWVFHNDCLCPLKWQWQVGVVAVFLGWIVLTLFISKFPKIGIYVLMFLNVFRTFLKVLLLSIFLVLAFALTFYLAFTEPEITV
jgi:transient receptor potential cation channel subfamily A protein 1